MTQSFISCQRISH